MPHSTKNKKDEVITPRKSVHVIFYSCPNCQEEIEEIKVCACGEPMKVINVVEKFGDEAEKYIEQAKKEERQVEDDEEGYTETEKEEPNIILMDQDAKLDGEDTGIDPTKDDEMGLDIIFPDEDHEEESPKVELGADDELSKALEQLDEEEDVSADDFDGLVDGEMPTL